MTADFAGHWVSSGNGGETRVVESRFVECESFTAAIRSVNFGQVVIGIVSRARAVSFERYFCRWPMHNLNIASRQDTLQMLSDLLTWKFVAAGERPSEFTQNDWVNVDSTLFRGVGKAGFGTSQLNDIVPYEEPK
jgi:hypothetical protein